MADLKKIQALFEQAQAYQEKGDYDKAIETLTQVIELKPDDAFLAFAYTNRGSACLSGKR